MARQARARNIASHEAAEPQTVKVMTVATSAVVNQPVTSSGLTHCPAPEALPEALYEKRELADTEQFQACYPELDFLNSAYSSLAQQIKALEEEKAATGRQITEMLDSLKLKGVSAPGVSVGLTYSHRESLDKMTLLANGVSADVLAASTRTTVFRFPAVRFGKGE